MFGRRRGHIGAGPRGGFVSGVGGLEAGFDGTDVADAAAFWVGGERDVELGTACFADG